MSEWASQGRNDSETQSKTSEIEQFREEKKKGRRKGWKWKGECDFGEK